MGPLLKLFNTFRILNFKQMSLLLLVSALLLLDVMLVYHLRRLYELMLPHFVYGDRSSLTTSLWLGTDRIVGA